MITSDYMLIIKENSSQEWQYKSIIPAMWKAKAEVCKFKLSCDNLPRPCPKMEKRSADVVQCKNHGFNAQDHKSLISGGKTEW